MYYICIYIYIHTHTRTHTHARTHTHTFEMYCISKQLFFINIFSAIYVLHNLGIICAKKLINNCVYMNNSELAAVDV